MPSLEQVEREEYEQGREWVLHKTFEEARKHPLFAVMVQRRIVKHQLAARHARRLQWNRWRVRIGARAWRFAHCYGGAT